MKKVDIEFLKNLFSYSSDNVYISDYNLNLLWYSRQNTLPENHSINLKELFTKEQLPLSSGEYFIKHNGLSYSCHVINYPECENGVYVIQTSDDDVMLSFIKSQTVQQFLMNCASDIRQAITGITFASNVLHKALDESDLFEEHKQLDITLGNCYKLMRTVFNMTEPMKYAADMIVHEKINVSDLMAEFANNCRKIIGGSIKIETHIQDNLFITADTQRLISCLLSMVILANGNIPENNVIVLSAEKIGNYVSLTAGSEQNGSDLPKRTFTHDEHLYKDDDVNYDLLTLSRFCRAFDGTLYVFGGEKEKTFSIKLPFCDSPDAPIMLNSSVRPYPDDKFSVYHIMLSSIADIFYYL